MVVFAIVVVWFINSFALFARKRSRLICLLSLILLVLVMAGNNYNHDYFTYLKDYENLKQFGISNVKDTEYLFYYFELLLSKLGFDYQSFLIAYFSIGLLLLYRAVEKYNGNFHFFILLYTLYPMFMDIVQIRSFYVMIAVLYAFRYLYTNNLKNNIFFVSWIVVGALFQSTSLLWLLVLVCVRIYQVKEYKIRLLLISIEVAAIVAIIMNANIILNFAVLTENRRLLTAISNRQRLGYLIQYSEQFILVFISIWMNRKIDLYNNGVESDSPCGANSIAIPSEYIHLTMIFSISCLCFLPFYSINSNFQRYISMQMPIYYIAFSMMHSLAIPKSARKYGTTILFVGFICVLFYLHIYGMQYMIEYITKHNIFLIGL